MSLSLSQSFMVDCGSSCRYFFPFADLVYQGEHNPLPLMSKGKNDVEDLEVTIKSKGGDCWHYDSGLALWYRCRT